jgi:hypothetical protein
MQHGNSSDGSASRATAKNIHRRFDFWKFRHVRR